MIVGGDFRHELYTKINESLIRGIIYWREKLIKCGIVLIFCGNKCVILTECVMMS